MIAGIPFLFGKEVLVEHRFHHIYARISLLMLALLLSRLTTDDMLSKKISLGTPPVALNDAIRQSNTSCLVLYSY